MIVYLFLFIFCLFQLSSLLSGTFPSSHDGMYHIVRIQTFFDELIGGQFPVRWANALDNHFGIPIFNFFYPGPYLLSSIPMALHLGPLISYKIIMIVGYLFGAIGIYRLLASRNKFLALISALLYTLTPYLFLNIFVRGDIAEVVVMGFMPWVLCAFQFHKYKTAIIALFFVLISHNLLAILFLIFLIYYLLFTGRWHWREFFTLLTSLGLSAFFWLPMIIERQYLASGTGLHFTFDYRHHFVYLQQLFYGKWDYWYSLPGPADGMSFQVGFASIAIIILATVGLIFCKNRKNIIVLYPIILICLFLTLTYSEFIWTSIPILGIVQFPWRFLFLPTLLVPILLFEVLTNLPQITLNKKYVIGISLVLLAFYNVRNYRRPMVFLPISTFQTRFIEESRYTTTTARGEIVPRWTVPDKFEGGVVIDSQRFQSIPRTLVNDDIFFTLQTSTTVTIRKNYYPGWQLVNQATHQRIKIQPDTSGDITSALPAGSYGFVYHQTDLEILANAISLLSLGTLLYYYKVSRHRQNK